MTSENVFRTAIIISVFTHGLILFKLSHPIFYKVNKKQEDYKVTYVRKKEEKSLDKQKDILPAKIILERKLPLPPIDKNAFLEENRKLSIKQGYMDKPEFVNPDIIAIKKKITLSPIDTEKMDNPNYISYYQIVREKIRRSAYHNYSHTETGEAYLTFIVAKNGTLVESQLIPEKSSDNPYLSEIGLRSVKDASPFPPFPEELDYPQLSFNVIISFEIE